MIRKTLFAAIACGFFAAPAVAGHCPMDIAPIDSALENAALDPEVETQVKKLRDEGQALH